MSLVAAIDAGSNTFRFLVALLEDKGFKDIYTDRSITRLGDGLSISGMLREDRMYDSIEALKKFASICSKYNVEKIYTFGTSALREASNADIFIEKAFEETGIKIEVLPGKKEAELTLKGIIYAFRYAGYRPPYLIIDIGGGSTEFIFYKGANNLKMWSIPIGVIKLCQRYNISDVITEDELNNLEIEILPVLENLQMQLGMFLDSNILLSGSAGTFSTIASIDLQLEEYSREKIHLHTISLEKLIQMFKRLISLNLEQRKSVKGLEPERADLIIPGLLFTIKIMDYLGFNKLIISEYGILEGAVLEMSNSI